MKNTGHNIVHILFDSFPHISGYTVRSHSVLKSLPGQYNSSAITFNALEKPNTESPMKIHGVTYHLCQIDGVSLVEKMCLKMKGGRNITRRYLYRKQLTRMFRDLKPTLIHAHSPYMVAAPALTSAENLNLPIIYEVRGLWHESCVANNIIKRNSFIFRRDDFLEMKIIKQVPAVVTISEALKRYLIARGIDKDKIFVVPNGVDTHTMKPVSCNVNLRNSLNINGELVLGYVGNVRYMEGLHFLFKAVSTLQNTNIKIKVLIIGEGEALPSLEKLARDMEIKDSVEFLGMIGQDLLPQYYSVIDAIILPRINSPVNRLVTPLKPLEAMSFSLPVLASDLPTIREVILEGRTGLLFQPESPQHIATILRFAYQHKDLLQKMGIQGREWVTQNRDWSQVVSNYDMIYSTILSRYANALN